MFENVSIRQTFANVTRCFLVLAGCLLFPVALFSFDDCSSDSRVSSAVEVSNASCEIMGHRRGVVPAESSLPGHVENSEPVEMFAARISVERWRQVLARAVAFDQFVPLSLNSPHLFLRKLRNRYSQNPPFVAPERFQTQSRQVRGDPVSRSLLKNEQQRGPFWAKLDERRSWDSGCVEPYSAA